MNDVEVRLEGSAEEVLRYTGDALRHILHPVAEAAIGVEDRLVGTLVEEELVLALDGRLQTADESGAAVRAAEEATLSADELLGSGFRRAGGLGALRFGDAVGILRLLTG